MAMQNEQRMKELKRRVWERLAKHNVLLVEITEGCITYIVDDTEIEPLPQIDELLYYFD